MSQEIQPGHCGCGCGEKTQIAKITRPDRGWTKGQPKRFLKSHALRVRDQCGAKNPLWSGGRINHSDGYVLILEPAHPRATRGYVLEHVAIATRVLGRPLPNGVEIHHADGDRGNNLNSNLVICQDHAYHQLLHARARALRACGHASWRKCTFCRNWDDMSNLKIRSTNGQIYHPICKRDYQRNYRLARSSSQSNAA